MKIAMLLPLLPLYAAAQKTAACPNNGAACHCGAENPYAKECLAMWMIHGPTDDWEPTWNKQCARRSPCQSCDWCEVPEDEVKVEPEDEESQVRFKCLHDNCKNWKCAEWCHCYEKGFDAIYAKAGCIGEDTCNCK